VKLLGLSPSGFNATGESDIRNYYDHILSQNELILRKGIKKALDVLQVVEFGEIDPNIDFEFNSLWSMDEAQQADIDSKNTATILSIYENQVIDADTVVAELKARQVFKSEVLAEEQQGQEEGDIDWSKIVPANHQGADNGANLLAA
jgi:phage-related protein (TIGR01555 family)